MSTIQKTLSLDELMTLWESTRLGSEIARTTVGIVWDHVPILIEALRQHDAMWGITLLGELNAISELLNIRGDESEPANNARKYQAHTRLDQLRVRISRDVRRLQEQEAGSTNG